MRPAVLLFLCAAPLCFPEGGRAQTEVPFRPLAALDLRAVRLTDFSDAEIDLPFYLAHFARLADSVERSGVNRGFIAIPVWRAVKDNQPHNARIMENILSLAWFYCSRRPWNVYYGDPGLRDRLEAALAFWCGIQGPQGQFSEYGPGRWNLAATAFATKFMGQTLTLLEHGPPVNAALKKRVIEADRKAIMFVLSDAGFWKHALDYSNQFTNVIPGALAFLRLYPDAELESLFWKKIGEGGPLLQSPAGYFYEAGGPDFGYNLNTHHSNLHGAWHYTRGTERGEIFLREERGFAEWLSYNAVPDGAVWALNRGIETRQQHAIADFREMPMAERVPLLRAFLPATDEIAERAKRRRAEWLAKWPAVEPLKTGEFWSFSPYAFLHREQVQWFPSPAQREEARRSLPYLARREFIHQRMDSRHPAVFTYVRRPAYYAAFNSGKRITARQRLGLGLVWTQKGGVALQSQSNSNEAAWGTRATGSDSVFEAGDVPAEFAVDGRKWDPSPGNRDLPGGTLAVRYRLGAAGEKTLEFLPREIRVAVRLEGEFTEQVPVFDEGYVASSGRRTSPEPQKLGINGKRLRVVKLPGRDRLSYSIVFP